jgi:hypothetical protein
MNFDWFGEKYDWPILRKYPRDIRDGRRKTIKAFSKTSMIGLETP